ncbi:MAG: EPS-associated MarR family transcriptional regulator [Parasphingorhabdus sp.]|jgi:EPS-associated MarR family transcriptional regulator|tara:strand:- start:274 stop:705 length:432 start_codon:yes stop_codon:yes gene_type:complete
MYLSVSGRFRRSAVAVEPMEPITRSPTKARLSDRESIDYELLSMLEQKPDLSQRELSRRLGISLGRVNYCLQALAAKGWVKLENFRQSPHKQRYVYALTPAGIASKGAMTGRFLKRKLAEYEHLKAQIALLERELPGQDEDAE